MPIRTAPTMSAEGVSPTITTSPGASDQRVRMASKIGEVGLVQPTPAEERIGSSQRSNPKRRQHSTTKYCDDALDASPSRSPLSCTQTKSAFAPGSARIEASSGSKNVSSAACVKLGSCGNP